MNKFNTNCILFAFATGLILYGLFGNSCIRVAAGTAHMVLAIVHFDTEGIESAKASIDKATSELLNYHDIMMDIDSIRNNIWGTRVIYKDDTTVIKSDSDSLIEVRSLKSEKELNETVTRIKELEDVAEDNGAKFLYCAIPTKNMFTVAPSNVPDYSKENYQNFLMRLNDENIPTLDLSIVMDDSDAVDTDYYYRTDHHWKAECGFKAAGALCEELSNRYSFSYNEAYTDISNYEITTFKNWFLGSYGKKVGLYFTWYGADDFDLITPKFSTSFVVEEPFDGEKREGTFEDTILFKKYVDEKDYYENNPYGVYSGGDYRLQIIENNLNLGGKKVLVLRDSFSCPLTPFLSLQTRELHICDMRDFIPDEKMNMADYIQQQKPDYVIVIFSGVHGIEKGGRFDFF
ncbi:alginate O-acetyltransferase AlgX-related protein [Butyrivibrio sp. AE2015]|uniref:alginate O-acetyltransferase AlgX-related protein n=1 Tax=Butyrivibrio sp. AE2015 TaxID=1280663 RepID=UPI0003B4B0E7|nr:hypothetical protein [Butyrivibrio sp. AE2015]